MMGPVAMMRPPRIRRCALLLGAFFALASASWAVELYFKASGGFVRSRFADVDQALKDWSASWQAFVAALPGWGFEQTGVLRQSGCTAFGAELLAALGRRWGVGLGLGVLYSNFVDLDAPLYVQKPDVKIEYMSPTKIAAYPIYGFGQYAFPLGKKWAAYLSAGVGVLPAKYIHREKRRDLKDVDPAVELAEFASASGTFLLAGTGLRYTVDPGLSLFAEAGYVLSKVGSFEGEVGTGGKGLLYYYQEYEPDLDFWQTKLRLQAAAPSGLSVRAVRKASLDFGGLSLRLGLMMRL
jgi:hypothetical protein